MAHLARAPQPAAPTPRGHSVGLFVAVVLLALVCALCGSAEAATGDPAGRVGRVSLVNGSVDAATDPAADWTPASLNMPVSSGTTLRTGLQSRAEWRVGSVSLQMNVNSQLQVQTLDDASLIVLLQYGNLALHLRTLVSGERVEVHADDAVFIVTAPGSYHFTHQPGARRFNVKVFEGAGSFGAAAPPLGAGQQALWDLRTQAVVVQGAAERTHFDEWATLRAQRAERPSLGRYVSAEMTGAEELDEHGRWQTETRFGPVWYPNAVDAEWAPYRYGRWVWVAPWGWTWVDDAPWGFAPFHYGRWLFLAGRWGWVPGTYVARPVYAPALVGFYGGAPGHDAAWVGWFPLAPGEAYRPGFAASAGYLQNLNAGAPGMAPPAAPNSYRYAHTSFAATAVVRESFGSAQAAGTARVALSPSALSIAGVLATNSAPAPAPSVGRAAGAGPGTDAAVVPRGGAARPVPEVQTPPTAAAERAAAHAPAGAEAPDTVTRPGHREPGQKAARLKLKPRPLRLPRHAH